jgi:2-amino-4-hydroxy-6-hydroxymethyldihydropteridine diphosphokinase
MTLDPLDKQADYWNAVCMVDTVLTPEEVLDEALWCEQQWGRQRRTKWGSRTLDVDILLYGDKNIHTPRVTVPHPGWKDRIFVLAPLVQLQERVCVEGEWFDVRKMLHEHASCFGGILEIADGGF